MSDPDLLPDSEKLVGSRYSGWLQRWPGQVLCGLFKVDRWCDLWMFPWISLEHPRPLGCEIRPASWWHPCLLPLVPLGVWGGYTPEKNGQKGLDSLPTLSHWTSPLQSQDLTLGILSPILPPPSSILLFSEWSSDAIFLLPKWLLPGWSCFLAGFQKEQCTSQECCLARGCDALMCWQHYTPGYDTPTVTVP